MFSYFEQLFLLKDQGKVMDELARLMSLNSLLESVGIEEVVYEDFVNPTFVMLQEVSDAIAAGSDESFLVAAFNDEMNEFANSIIMHARVSQRQESDWIFNMITLPVSTITITNPLSAPHSCEDENTFR